MKTTAALVKLIAFATVTVLATALLATTISNASFTKAKEYSAVLSDVTGVLEGDDVRIAGVRVGEVQHVEVYKRTKAKVTFTVDEARRLPKSTQVAIRWRNLIGQRYLALSEGAGSGSSLPEGATIPMSQTAPALDLDLLFDGFKPLFQALDGKQVNKLATEIVRTLQGEAGSVNSLLSHTASLTTTIAEKDQVIGQVIGNLNQVLDTVNARGPQLSDLVVKLQQLVSGLAQDRKPIGDAIQALGGLTDSTSQLLQEGREPLKQNIDALGKLTNNLNDHETLVEHFIQFLPEKTKKLTSTASYGSWFNFFVCEAEVTVGGLPGVKPITLPLAPVTQDRCKS